MLSRRFSCPAVNEAAYEPREVPACDRSMKNTVLVRPARSEWLLMLGEMVQMLNEAVRRRASSALDASKPLSLEYMADRMDVDDPLFGYLAVTKDTGWLQGFVTCTTFTTWQRGFRWDSTNPQLELHVPHGDDVVATASKAGEHRQTALAVDADGALSDDMQCEVHAGNPDEEGIVWPRVAEISLLGGLGCGRWLVQLIIDGLEAPDSPYHFVVVQVRGQRRRAEAFFAHTKPPSPPSRDGPPPNLPAPLTRCPPACHPPPPRACVPQATDGSVPFYERMGFVRVGAVTVTQTDSGGASATEQEAAAKRRKKGDGSAAGVGDVVSRHEIYVCEEEGETCASIAAQFDVDPWEVNRVCGCAWACGCARTCQRLRARGLGRLQAQAPRLARALLT